MKFIFIDIGSLRADHLGCYGYQRPTSPTIDKLAAEGLICNAAFSSNATNAGSRAAIFSGRLGIETGIVTDGFLSDIIRGHTPISSNGLDAPRPMLAEYLSSNGMQTAAITPFGRQNARWFYSGWQEVYDTHPEIDPVDVDAAAINKSALPWINQNSENDFFLYLTYNNLSCMADSPLTKTETNYLDSLSAHGEPPVPDKETFNGHHNLHAAFSARTHGVTSPNAIRQLIHKYNAKIRAIDDCVAEIVSLLEKLNVLDDTAIIITGDHGILLGECGCYSGHISAHYNCSHVPLIIRAPKKLGSGIVFNGLCYSLDISATILDMLGLKVPTGYHSLSIPGLMENSPEGRNYVVASHGHYTAQRAIISEGWKLNRTWHNGFWQFDDTELYNIKEDSSEKNNLVNSESEHVLSLMKKIHNWTNEFCSDKVDPLAAIACSEPPGFLTYGQELRERVIRGEITPPENYNGRWR